MRITGWKAASLAAAVFAVACGGGGGGGGTDTGGGADIIVGGDDGSNLADTKTDTTPPKDGQEAYELPPPPIDHGPTTDVGPDTQDTITPPPDEGQDPGVVGDTVKPDTQPDQNPVDTNPPLDEGSCKAYYQCVGACPPQPQGQACIQECQNKLSPQGMQDVQNLQNCLQQNKCFDKPTDQEFNQCLEDFCIEPYFHCFSGTLYQSCSALIDCLTACPEDNPNTPDVNEKNECIGNCWSEATFDAQMDLQNLINCANKNCEAQCATPDSPACNSCWNQVLGPGGVCESYNDKCTVYGPEGCYYLLTCLNGCDKGDQQCQQACVNQTSKNGLKLYNDIFDCITQACPICESNPDDPQCDTCFKQAQQPGAACYGVLQTCLNDRPYGTKKCGEMFQCVNACADQACVQDCLLNGTKTANDLYDAMITCAMDQCPSCQTNPPGADCDTCFNGALQDAAKCKTKYDACVNDNAAQ